LTAPDIRVTVGNVKTRTYTKSARAVGEERTRTALLDAAQEAFFSSSWDQVSLETIAGRAGVTKQTLLRHFGSKDGLLEQGFLRGFERVRAQRMAAPAGDVEGAVDNLLDHYAEYGEQGLKIAAMNGGGLIAEIGSGARQLHYDWVEHAFGDWLGAATGKQRGRLHGALVALCDVHTWAILARDLGLERTEVRATLVLAIRRLLEEPT
jgi:AcrR family transcriptional regulator